MFTYCLGCKCKANINNCKYVTFNGKGSKMRTRIEGVCEKGHKFNRIAKSSGVMSLSKTMNGGGNCLNVLILVISCVQILLK